jgi:hypothetical protein
MLVICAMLTAVALAAEDQDGVDRQLEGTWRVTLTPDAGGPPPSLAYHTYAGGGVLIQSNLLSEGPIPGHGVWARTGKGEFALTFEKFFAVNPITGQQGIFIFKVREKIKLDGDRYNGRGEAFICDTAGHCTSLGFAASAAQRMTLN